MALPGPASLAFTPLPTPSLSLFTRRTSDNEANVRNRKETGKATRPSTSPGIYLGSHPSSPPAPSNGEIGQGGGRRARRISLFHRPFSVVFADEDEKHRRPNHRASMHGLESGTATPMPTPKRPGLRRGRATSMASYSTPSTPSSTTPSTPFFFPTRNPTVRLQPLHGDFQS